MFTGLIEATGEVAALDYHGSDARMVIATILDLSQIKPGDSIAVDGVCLTVVELGAQRFAVDVSAETLAVVKPFALGEAVNLELAMRLSDRLGGHLLSGHIDGKGRVVEYAPVGDNFTLSVEVPPALMRYIAIKGSIAINGVSLTVNNITKNDIVMNIIPHTWANTTFKNLTAGANVNLEVDMLARYVERMLNCKA